MKDKYGFTYRPTTTFKALRRTWMPCETPEVPRLASRCARRGRIAVVHNPHKCGCYRFHNRNPTGREIPGDRRAFVLNRRWRPPAGRAPGTAPGAGSWAAQLQRPGREVPADLAAPLQVTPESDLSHQTRRPRPQAPAYKVRCAYDVPCFV